MQQTVETFCPANRQQWRDWLEQHHQTKPSIWLIYHKKKSGNTGISYAEAVEEALCFGWIDSKSQPVDEHTYRQFFSRRKSTGTWSKVNKEILERLIANGVMAPAGLATIEAAKQNGSWTILDEVEQHIVPPDLQAAFQNNLEAESYFGNLSRSDKRNMLQWLVLAKRSETRQARIADIVNSAAQGLKPKPFQKLAGKGQEEE